MCLRVYLNGDGTGRGTHLSLFFVVMKGPNDALLRWPFNQKVREAVGHLGAPSGEAVGRTLVLLVAGPAHGALSPRCPGFYMLGTCPGVASQPQDQQVERLPRSLLKEGIQLKGLVGGDPAL